MTNSRTFLELRITRIFMSAERPPFRSAALRERAILTEGFSSGRIARGMLHHRSRRARWDFPELFPTAAITEFVRAAKFRIPVNRVTYRIFHRNFRPRFLMILPIDPRQPSLSLKQKSRGEMSNVSTNLRTCIQCASVRAEVDGRKRQILDRQMP